MMKHKGLVVSLRLEDGKPSHCLDHSYDLEGGRTVSGSVCAEGVIESVTVSEFTAERVAGAVDWKGDDGENVVVRFDLPIEASGD